MVLTEIIAKTGSKVLMIFSTLPNFLISALNLMAEGVRQIRYNTTQQTSKTSLVNDFTRKDVGPEFGIGISPKTNLHTNVGSAEAQFFEHGICIMEDWARPLDTVVDITGTILVLVDGGRSSHASR
jgi:hypothetical protein